MLKAGAVADDRRSRTESIWRELSDRLRQFIRSRVGQNADVDDILQDVFVRIHSNLDTLRDAGRIESWIFQVARNAIADHFRRRRVAVDDADLSVTDSSAGETHRELAHCVRVLIEALPERTRQMLFQHEIEGVPQVELAEQNALPVSTVKSRVQRGRRAVREVFRECCELEFDRRGRVIRFDGGSDCAQCDC